MHTVAGIRAHGLGRVGSAVVAFCFFACLAWSSVRAERMEVVAIGITDNAFVGSGDPCSTGQTGGNACNYQPIAITLIVETGSAGSDGVPAETNRGYYRNVQAPGFIAGFATINGHLFRMPTIFQFNFDQLIDMYDDLDGSGLGLDALDRVQFGVSGGNAAENFSVSPNFIMTGGAFSGDLLDDVGEIAGSPLALRPGNIMLSNGSFNFANATGAVQGQFWIETASFRYVLPTQPQQGMPDVSGGGVRDVAVFRGVTRTVEVRSGVNGSLIRNITFLSSDFRPVSGIVVPDTDGNGIPEIAVLARRLSDRRTVVEIRNASGNAATRQIWFEPDRRPVDLAVIAGDADGNGSAELALLSRRNSDGRGVVEIKNAFGAANTAAVWLGAGLTPQDMEVVADADGNGVPEVAVMSTRSADGRVAVEVRNASGAPGGATVWFSSGNAAVDLATTADADGDSVQEVAVLMQRRSDVRGLVEVRNASGPTNARQLWLAAGNYGVAIERAGDADGNSVPDVAVLAARTSDGRALVEVKNTFGPVNTNTLWYSSGFAPAGLMVLEDLDFNGVAEAAPLLIRSSDGRLLVQRRNASGTQLPVNYWFAL